MRKEVKAQRKRRRRAGIPSDTPRIERLPYPSLECLLDTEKEGYGAHNTQ